MLFDVPPDADLRDYLVKSVNFSRLFAALTQLIEPFAQMLNEIYTFLANYKSSAQTAENHSARHQELRRLIISEGVDKDLQFDLDSFPTVQKPILQRVQVSAARFDHELKLNHNCSPLFLAESLLEILGTMSMMHARTILLAESVRRRLKGVMSTFFCK